MAAATLQASSPHLFWCTHNAFAAKFSPYSHLPSELLAVATSQHYGIAGNGRAHVVTVSATTGLTEIFSRDTQDCLFDVAWSEANEHQLVGVCGDGSTVLWDLRSTDPHPVARWTEHGQEAVGVAWAPVSKLTFATASWDGTVRIMDPLSRAAVSVLESGEPGSRRPLHAVEWHPTHAGTLSSGGADGVCVWDVRSRDSRASFGGGVGEILSLDWNKFREFEILAGGSDGAVRIWDTRRAARPVRLLQGHRLPVRRVRCSPHDTGIAATASYDFTVCLWDTSNDAALHATLLQRCSHHREFASGVEFSLFIPGLLASCSWDHALVAWNYRGGFPPPVLPRHAVRATGDVVPTP